MKRITDLARTAARATSRAAARLLPVLTLTCAASRAALILTCAATLAAGLASCTADDLDTRNPGALNPDATPLTVASLPGFADTATPGTRADFDPSAPIGTTDPGKTDWAEGDTLAIKIEFYADTEPTTEFFGITHAYAIYNGSAWVLGNGLTTVNVPDLENLPLAVAGGKVAWPARAKAMQVYAVYAPGQTFAADGYLITTRPKDAGQREWWIAVTDLLTTPGDAIVLNNWQALCARIRVAAAPGDVVKFAAPRFCPAGALWDNPLSTPAGTNGKRPGEPVDFLTATADALGNAYFYGVSYEKTPITVSLTRSTLYADTETPVFQGEKHFVPITTGKSYAINALAESEWDGAYVGTVARLDKTKSKWVITDEAPDCAVLSAALQEIADADATRRVSIELLKAKSVGEKAFVNCANLTTITLPVATEIGESAFNGCTALQSITLPAATLIGEAVFQSCAALANVELPAATEIGEVAFGGCTALTTLTFGTPITKWGAGMLNGANDPANITLTLAAGQKAMTWNDTVAVFTATATAFTDFGTNKTFCGGSSFTPYTFAAILQAQ